MGKRVRTRRTWDHPRVCGEHASNVSDSSRNLGSSPRMRGTRHTRPVRGRGTGIIPAYAGNTSYGNDCKARDRDHPRVCGEHCHVRRCLFPQEGSSPRMRGTHLAVNPRPRKRGIIPAYAGNTSVKINACARHGDHPRVCGEHVTTAKSVGAYIGSSPRMRGTRESRFSDSIPHGIIPAYAGNTLTSSSTVSVCWDHPRVCGEHCRFR